VSKKTFSIGLGLSLILLYVFSPVVNASASYLYQTLTATPTVTAPPIYFPTIAATPEGGVFSCPADGTPIVGYGTVTPDSLWDLMCSQCVVTPYLTNTPYPVSTVTGTPPTSTPTLIASVTPSPTSIVDRAFISCGSTSGCIQVDPYTIDLHSSGYASIEGSELTGHSDSYPYALSESSDIYVRLVITDAHQVWHAGQTWDGTLDISRQFDTIIFEIPSTIETFCEGCAARVAVPSEYDFTFYEPDLAPNLHISYHDYPSIWNAYRFTPSHLYLSTVEGGFNTPTPTPIATEATPSYCDEVSNGGDDGFDWGGIEVGETSCFDVGGFDWYWGFGTAPDSIPWLAHVCVTDISFGDLKAFDVTFDLDIVLYALGAVMIIRNMFVS